MGSAIDSSDYREHYLPCRTARFLSIIFACLIWDSGKRCNRTVSSVNVPAFFPNRAPADTIEMARAPLIKVGLPKLVRTSVHVTAHGSTHLNSSTLSMITSRQKGNQTLGHVIIKSHYSIVQAYELHIYTKKISPCSLPAPQQHYTGTSPLTRPPFLSSK
jgi:hypothetical protein